MAASEQEVSEMIGEVDTDGEYTTFYLYFYVLSETFSETQMVKSFFQCVYVWSLTMDGCDFHSL